MERLYVALSFLRFLPHLLVFAFSGNRAIIKEDLCAYKNEYDLTGSTQYIMVHLLTHNTSFESENGNGFALCLGRGRLT